MIKKIIAVGAVVMAAVSCSLQEDVKINANNSIDRDMLTRLDTVAAGKLAAMASMMGGQEMPVKLDSIGLVWDSASTMLVQTVKDLVPGATGSRVPWNSKTASGAVHFNLPDMDAYNRFAGSTMAVPSGVREQMPVGGLKKQQLEWHGKDTLVISLDNSAGTGVAPAVNKEEMKQALGMVKLMLGIASLVEYKASFYLPRAAKSATGAVLSPDKKKVTLETSLDEPNESGQPEKITVVF